MGREVPLGAGILRIEAKEQEGFTMELNEDTLLGAALGIGLLVFLKTVVLLIFTKGSFARILETRRLALLMLKGQDFVAKEEIAKSPFAHYGPQLRLLGLLQRDANLLDFLLEDISGVSDASIAAAVRDIQPKARLALGKYLTVAPCVEEKEGALLEVPSGYTPSQYSITGNVPPHPPYKGEVRHRGWKAISMNLPPLAKGDAGLILAPVEVEVA